MLRSHIDLVNSNKVAGWALDAAQPNEPVELSILIDGKECGRVLASQFRNDLRALGTFGDGRHGFAYDFNPPLNENQEVSVLFSSSNQILPPGKFKIRNSETGAEPDGASLLGAIAPSCERAAGPKQRQRYVIHVGPHKTGTTYLQLGFHQMQSRFAERKILFPAQWFISPTNPNHFPLYTRISKGDRTLQREIEALARADFATVLISSEDLSDLSSDSLRTLKHYLGDASVDIVFYCRRWSDLMPSGWQEIVKQGSSVTLPDYIDHQVTVAHSSGTINYGLKLDKFIAIFGEESVKIVSYSNLADTNSDITGNFLALFLYMRDYTPPTDTRPNASLNIFDIEVIRALNDVTLKSGGIRNARIRDLYLKRKAHLDLSALHSFMRENIKKVALRDSISPLADLHNALFQKFGHLLVEPKNDGLFFTPKEREISYIGDDYLNNDEAFAQIGNLYKELI